MYNLQRPNVFTQFVETVWTLGVEKPERRAVPTVQITLPGWVCGAKKLNVVNRDMRRTMP